MNKGIKVSHYAIPVRKTLVGRPELVRRCMASRGEALLFAAPAGFGKSSLAILCTREFEKGKWVSAHGGLGEDVFVAIEAALRELGDYSDAVLVLDNCDESEFFGGQSTRLLSFFEPYQNAGLTLIVSVSQESGASRAEEVPERWILFEQADLLFSQKEVKALVSRDGFGYSGATMEEIMRMTGGVASLVCSLLDRRASKETLEYDRAQMLVDVLSRVPAPLPEALIALLGYQEGLLEDIEAVGIVLSYEDLLALHRYAPALGITLDSLRFDLPSIPAQDFERIVRAQEVSPELIVLIAHELARRERRKRAAMMATIYADLGLQRGEIANWLRLWGRKLIDSGEFDLLETLEHKLDPSTAMETPECILLTAERLDLSRGDPKRVFELAASALPLLPSYADKVRCAELKLRATIEQGERSHIEKALLALERMDLRAQKSTFTADAGKRPSSAAIRPLDLATMSYAQLLLGRVDKGRVSARRAIDAFGQSQSTVFEQAKTVDMLCSAEQLLGSDVLLENAVVKGRAPEEAQTFGEALLALNLARSLGYAHKFNRAQMFFGNAKRYLEPRKLASLDLKFTEGILLRLEGRHEEACESLLASLRLALETGQEQSAARIRLMFSTVLRELGKYEEALSQAYSAQQYFASRKLDVLTALSQCETAFSYVVQGEIDSAIKINRAIPELSVQSVPLVRETQGQLGKKLVRTLSGEPLPPVHIPPPLVEVTPDILYLRLFGTIELSRNGHTEYGEDWNKRKALTLFCWLVMSKGHELSRDTILRKLWGTMDPDRARNNFYVTFSTMTKMLRRLGVEDCVRSRGGLVRIDSRTFFSDMAEFDMIADRVIGLSEQENPRELLEMYRRMQYLYRGPFAPGVSEEIMFIRPRALYHDRFLQGMIHASQIALSIDDAKLAVWFAQQAYDQESGREEVYQALMRAQHAAGQRGGALESFHRCRAYLAGELGLSPSKETMALYNELLTMDAGKGVRFQ